MSGDHGTKEGDPTQACWRDRDGQPIACREKLKVLDENFEELSNVCQDALDDAEALGCAVERSRSEIGRILSDLDSSLRPGKG